MDSSAASVWVGGWQSLGVGDAAGVVHFLKAEAIYGAEVVEFRRKVYGESRGGSGGGSDGVGGKGKRKRETSFAFAVLRFASNGDATQARESLESQGLSIRALKGRLGSKKKRRRGRGGGGGGGEGGDEDVGRAGSQQNSGDAAKTRLSAEEDPSLVDQLRPLSIQELAERVERLTGKVKPGDRGDKDRLLSTLATAHASHGGRPTRRVRCGRDVPPRLARELEAELRRFPWPRRRQRRRLVSERYCVLERRRGEQRGAGGPGAGAAGGVSGKAAGMGGESGGTTTATFLALCEELMRHATGREDGPPFPWSHVAVTLNFQGSPHLDVEDRSYQYALSLGDFSVGGELCLDSFGATGVGVAAREEQEAGAREAGFSVLVCDTRRKLQRVDGRFTHWVRGHDGGDRFSLIFYLLGDETRDERTWAVDESYE